MSSLNIINKKSNIILIISFFILISYGATHAIAANEGTLTYFATGLDIISKNSSIDSNTSILYAIIELKIINNNIVELTVRKPTLEELGRIINITGTKITIANGTNMTEGRIDIFYDAIYSEVAFKSVSVIYELDDKNYVVNFREVGFFPLYSVIGLDRDTIDTLRPVYMGMPLECADPCVAPGYYNSFININRTDFTILWLQASGGSVPWQFYYKWNYLVYADTVRLPVNSTHEIILYNVAPYGDTLRLIDGLPEYDIGANNDVLMIGLAVIIVVALAAVVWRMRGR